MDPYNLKETELAVRAALAVDEPSVVICRRECVLLPGQKRPSLQVDEARCNGCGLCLKVGCPAIVREGQEKVRIESLLCTGCTICQQTCFRGAIQQPADSTTEGGK